MWRNGNLDVAPTVPPLDAIPQRGQHGGRQELPRNGFGDPVQRNGAGFEQVIIAGILLLRPGVDPSLQQKRVDVPLVAFVDGDGSRFRSFG